MDTKDITKVDIHTNLNVFPTSKKSSKVIEATIEEMVAFEKLNGIGVNLVLYPRDGYDALVELDKANPDCQHIGVQVLMGIDANDATDMVNLELDVNDPNKSFVNGGLCYGIKIASHRGWWLRKGVVNSGMCYGNGDGSQINKWLKSMPEGAICSMHMQGDPINNSASIPTQVGWYAHRHHDKKFIVNHCGDFGQGGFSNKPKKYNTVMKTRGLCYFPAYRHAHAIGIVDSAVAIANTMHNVLLDTSVHYPYKAEAMARCNQWAIGSDYPFLVKEGKKDTSKLFIQQEDLFKRDVGEDKVNEAHKRTYEWLTNSMAKLKKDSEWYDGEDKEEWLAYAIDQEHLPMTSKEKEEWSNMSKEERNEHKRAAKKAPKPSKGSSQSKLEDLFS